MQFPIFGHVARLVSPKKAAITVSDHFRRFFHNVSMGKYRLRKQASLENCMWLDTCSYKMQANRIAKGLCNWLIAAQHFHLKHSKHTCEISSWYKAMENINFFVPFSYFLWRKMLFIPRLPNFYKGPLTAFCLMVKIYTFISNQQNKIYVIKALSGK